MEIILTVAFIVLIFAIMKIMDLKYKIKISEQNHTVECRELKDHIGEYARKNDNLIKNLQRAHLKQ